MNNKFKYMTLSMVLLLVLHPFLGEGLWPSIFLKLLVSLVCSAGVYAVSSSRRNLVIATLIGLPWLVLAWFQVLVPPTSRIMACVPTAFLGAFYLFTALVIFKFVLSSARAGQNALFGAMSVYLLVGATFAMVYTVIETLVPGSFYMDTVVNPDGVLGTLDFIYLSFTTLTSLGYGDICPVTPQARMLTVFEAIVGVMYLAVIIGRFVGIYAPQSSTFEPSAEKDSNSHIPGKPSRTK